MSEKPPINQQQSTNLRIRSLTVDDLETTRIWRNRPETRVRFFFDQEISAEEQQAWFELYLKKKNDLVFIVEGVETKEPIGQTSLYDIDFENGVAEFGRFMIGNVNQRSKGFGREALSLTCAVGFQQLELDEIFLNVKSDNVGAIKAYHAVGFSVSDEHDDKVTMRLKRDAFQPI